MSTVVPPAPSPYHFPDPQEEAYRRAQEFRRLSPDSRCREIAALMELGWAMVRCSQKRDAIERRWAAQEAEWQRIQRELFAQYGR